MKISEFLNCLSSQTQVQIVEVGNPSKELYYGRSVDWLVEHPHPTRDCMVGLATCMGPNMAKIYVASEAKK